MDHPERFELFVLPPDQKKVVYTRDTKMRDAGTFVIEKEDHTIGNLLRMQLLRDKRVLFAGYRCPHPLQARFELKVRTTSDYNPIQAVRNAISDLLIELKTMEESMPIQSEFDNHA